MRRILVALDGRSLAETIIPDARRLAGPDGVLVLVRDVPASQAAWEGSKRFFRSLAEADSYLDQIARILRGDGCTVETHRLTISDVRIAIDEAASIFTADMIACATHGDGPFGRLLRG